MKKPTGKQNKKNEQKKDQTNKSEKSKIIDDSKISLVVDSNDSYKEDLGIYYLNPARLIQAQHLKDKIFDSVTIKNSSFESLTSMNLNYILKKMKVDAPLEITIYQPLSVMQPFDAKQIEANAKLAGYDKIETKEVEIVENNLKVKTIKVTAVRPERNPNSVEVELQISKVKK